MTDIGVRLLEFAASVIKVTARLRNSAAARYIGGQLLRSASSAGANYREACAAESRADFVHKMQLVLKELRESDYWLQLLQKTDMADHSVLKPLSSEADELVRILVKSVVTAKSRAARR